MDRGGRDGMSKLRKYSGRYCESEYENAFVALLESVGWRVFRMA